jgi:hypothetical protein
MSKVTGRRHCGSGAAGARRIGRGSYRIRPVGARPGDPAPLHPQLPAGFASRAPTSPRSIFCRLVAFRGQRSVAAASLSCKCLIYLVPATGFEPVTP